MQDTMVLGGPGWVAEGTEEQIQVGKKEQTLNKKRLKNVSFLVIS